MSTIQKLLAKFRQGRQLKPHALKKAVEEGKSVVPTDLFEHWTVTSPEFERRRLAVIRLPYEVLTLIGIQLLEASLGGKLVSVDPTRLRGIKDMDTTRTLVVPWIQDHQITSTSRVLHPIKASANRILWLISQTRKLGPSGKPAATPAQLQEAVVDYQELVVNMLTGKGGLLRTQLFECRAQRSMRAVCVPDISLSHEEVGISVRHAKELDASHGDYVLLDREPILWMGSVLVMKLSVHQLRDDVIRINPFSHPLLNADFDGDCVNITCLDMNDPAVVKEAEENLSRTIKEELTWGAEFLLSGKGKKPDWENPTADLVDRLGMLQTLTPEDVLDPGSSWFLQQCQITGTKAVPTDLANYAKGVSIDEFRETARAVSLELTRTKREIGVIGSLTDRICQLTLANGPDLLPIALRVKERLTQLLLDSKSGSGCFDGNLISALFHARPPYQTTEVRDFPRVLQQELGFDPETLSWIELLLPVLKDYIPLNKGVEENLVHYLVAKSKDSAVMSEALGRSPDTSIAGIALGRLKNAANRRRHATIVHRSNDREAVSDEESPAEEAAGD